MPWQNFILKLVETLAWPFVVWLIWGAHKNQIRDLLSRIIKVGPSGLEAVPPQQQTLASVPGIAPGEAFGAARVEGIGRAEEASDIASMEVVTTRQQTDIVLKETERDIREHLKQTGQDNLPPDKQKELFITEYAKLLRSSNYYAISQNIFGTQIAALRQLANGPPQSARALEPIFEQHVQKTKERGLPPRNFSSWIAFLLNTKLVSVDKDGNYVITPMGKQFLEMYSATTNETTRLF